MCEDISPLENFTSLVDDRGVLKRIIKKGHTDISPVKGETVVVHYVGIYHGGDEHGEKFDSSRDRNEPLNYTSEEGHVIKGWDIAVPSMKLGEVCELVVSPGYGYQDGKTRRFEIELLDFYGKDVSPKFDGSVYLTQLVHGNEAISPRSGSLCKIHALGYCDGRVFEDRDVSFLIGDFEEVGLPEGLDRALCYMSEGEEARIRIREPMTFSSYESVKRGIPKGSILYYLVKITSCEQRKSVTVFSTFREKMEHMQSLKQKANELLKAGKYRIAANMYSDLLSDCLGVATSGYDQYAELNNFKCVLHQNRACAFLKLKSPQECLEACMQGLELNSRNEKCLYRKGEAYLLLGDHEEAAACFQEVLAVNAKNLEAVQKLKSCQDVISKALQREKMMFQSAFKPTRRMGVKLQRRQRRQIFSYGGFCCDRVYLNTV
uniref:peptidylprolyl isomerase n=1 Tax=Echinococcus granulosus TaxID=6210 RepID=A0A068WRC1_ECHGR|nr:peptidyl prolyl cis trans isomerase FKBP4 [Echinococcus granulosus]